MDLENTQQLADVAVHCYRFVILRKYDCKRLFEYLFAKTSFAKGANFRT